MKCHPEYLNGLREALRVIENALPTEIDPATFNYSDRHQMCQHQRWGYEGCFDCAMIALREVISEVEKP